MNGIRFFVLIIANWLCFAPTFAQNADSPLHFSLQEAKEYAVKNNLTIKNAHLNIDAAKQQVKEYKAIGMPQLNGSVGYTHNLKLPAQLVPSSAFGFPPFLPLASGDTLFLAQSGGSSEFQKITFGTKNNISLGAQATQLIFDGSYTLGLKAADVFVLRAQQETNMSENDLRNTVTETYTMALLAWENTGILKKNIGILQKVLNETIEYQRAGFAEQLDVDRLQLSIANLETQLKTAKRNAQLATGLLNFHLGIDLQKKLVLTDSLAGFIADAEAEVATPLQTWLSEAMDKRPELKLLETAKKFRELDIKQIKAKYLPSVAGFLQGQLNFQSNNLRIFKGEQWIPSAMVGIQVSIPLFDGFQKKAQIAQRVIAQQQVFHQESLLEQSIILQIINAHTQYLSALDAWQDSKKNIQLAQKIYNITLIKYKEGVGASLEVTNAESKLFETQALYLKALYDLVSAKNALHKAVGNP